MDGNDINSIRFKPELKDLSLATGLLTRIPLPNVLYPATGTRPAAHAAWAYPWVGAATGSICALVAWAALAVGLPAEAAALLALGSIVIVTGAMHEDGLADCADGFWGGWTPERRLEIMKDSQIGTYGVLALILVLGLRWIAVATLLGTPQWAAVLIGAAVASRAAMVGVMYQLANARQSGLSRQTGRPPALATGCAGIIGFGFLILGLPLVPWLALLLACATAAGVAVIAKAKIGGQTGDVLGATQQLVELAILLTCLTAL